METKIINLSNSEKKELRKIYGIFKDLKMYEGNCRMFETVEELQEEKKQIIEEYEKDFPKLKEENISIYDLPELIYSENQLRFINDAEETSFEIDYTYSGRGMYGDFCPCIRCDSHNDINTKAKTKIDSMGLGIVIYAEY